MSANPPGQDGEWTVGKVLSWSCDFLARHEVEEARLAGEILLAHALDCRRIDLYTRFDSVLSSQQRAAMRELVGRAAQHEPIAYLVGQKEFFSLTFGVTPAVLIPRPETETLVEQVIEHCRARALAAPVLLELGTGSGCIAVAVLKHLPGARVVATDIDPEALEVARQNAERHEVKVRLTLIEADRLPLPAEVRPAKEFDVVMSNPPYVAARDYAALAPNVREYEPRHALTDDANGLSFYTALAEEAPKLLTPGGAVFVEIAAGQAEAVTGLMHRPPHLSWRATIRDTVLGHERVLHFERGQEAPNQGEDGDEAREGHLG